MKKVQFSVVLVVVLLVAANSAFAQSYCYTPRCKSGNNGRPTVIYKMNGTDDKARADIKDLQGKNTDQDKRMDTMQTDINSRADAKKVQDGFDYVNSERDKTNEELKKTNGKVDDATKKIGEVETTVKSHDNSLFWMALLCSIGFLAAFTFAIIGWFLPRQNQAPANNQNNQPANNANNNQNQPAGQGNNQPGIFVPINATAAPINLTLNPALVPPAAPAATPTAPTPGTA